jgi:hypothetical protein
MQISAVRAGLNSLSHSWYSPKEMRHRSTLWFVIAAGWFLLLIMNLMRHHDLNTLVIGLAVALFLVIGLLYRSRDAKLSRSRQLRQAEAPNRPPSPQQRQP